MMGSFITRGLVMLFGYAYPAYECFKTLERNKPDIEQLRFWCQYWILVALVTVFERLLALDTFLSWLPMYSEAKLAFFIYLWYPNTKGTTYVYHSFFRPYLAKHETHIDRNLLDLKTRAGDIALLCFQNAATYGQTRLFQVLQYVASHSTPPTSQQGAGAGARAHHPPAAVRTQQADANSQQLPQQPPQLPHQPPSRTSSTTSTHKPPSRTSSTSSSQHQQPPSRTSSTGTTHQQQEPMLDNVLQAPAAAVQVEASGGSQPATQLTSQPNQTGIEAMQIDEPVASILTGNANPPPQETVMEEVIRVTRGRLRKNRATGKS